MRFLVLINHSDYTIKKLIYQYFVFFYCFFCYNIKKEVHMFFYNFDTLDNFIDTSFISNIHIEKEKIIEFQQLYENKKSNLLAITTNMIEITNLLDDKKTEEFINEVKSLKKCFGDLEVITSLIDNLKNLLDSTISLYDHGVENNKNDIKANLVEYNKKKDEFFDKILKFENLYSFITNSTIDLSLKTFNKKSAKIPSILPISEDKNKVNVELEPYDHNILVISEKEQKAYLPFFYNDVINIYNSSNNIYQTLEDVIEDLYIVPLDAFKSSTLSRFREAFHLIREKEKGSIMQALDLALELMFNYNLNPIIITACRNLEELDIYLDCLYNNQLDLFNCFEIKYEIMPQMKKNTFLF